jgi:tRNA-2-methylthio-N6-dimethylallyladenosine synthase
MPYFHLPIQSGNENVLKKMNRAMKIEDYLKLIKYIKTNLKNYSISTDLIVGFPNETKEEFEDTLKLYKEVEYDNAYTFIFSKRTGTAAASFLDEISQEEKKQRLYQLNALVQEYAKKNNEKLVGRTLEVLVEGNSKTNKSVLFGYSRE